MAKSRPKYLNLFRIRLPLPAFVSIAHRASGAFLFLLIPAVLSMWQSSLENGETFAAFRDLVSQPLMKLFVVAIVWAYLHHLCAGVRHLAMDLRYGVSLEGARATSWAVLAVSVAATAMFAVAIW